MIFTVKPVIEKDIKYFLKRAKVKKFSRKEVHDGKIRYAFRATKEQQDIINAHIWLYSLLWKLTYK